MSGTMTRLDAPGDAELISAVRGGDVDAYGLLFERHVDAARRLARQLVAGGDVEDLVSEAFIKVLGLLQRGGGPDVAFRAYLLTSVRRLHVDRIRATARLHTTDDLEQFDPGVPFRDVAVEGFESGAAARAFASLPERWQLVLWHTEVEGQRPADIAPLLGMSANSVSALAYRAREGLRQAFLNEHVADMEDEACRWTRGNLGPYVRNGISRRDGHKVEQHLEECRSCAAIYLELTDVNSNLAALLAPLLLGSLGVGYVSATTGAAAGSPLAALLDRAKDFVAANTQAVAVAGVATVVTVAGAGIVLAGGDSRPALRVDPPPASLATTAPPAPSATTSPAAGPRTRRPDRRRASPTTTATLPPAAPAPTPFVPVTTTPAPTAASTPPTPTPGPPGTTPGTTAPPAGGSSAPAPAAVTTTDLPAPAPSSSPTPAPSPGETPAPTPTPEPIPAPPPDPTPLPDPTPAPEPTPTPPAPPPVTVDVSIAIAVLGVGPLFDVTVTVEGLPEGTSATVTLSAPDVAQMQSHDQRCAVVDRVATCTVAPGEGPLVFDVTAPQGGTLTATVSAPVEDVDLANNTAGHTLP